MITLHARELSWARSALSSSRCHVIDAPPPPLQAPSRDRGGESPIIAPLDLALKEAGFGDLLPGAEAVILDEAHQVPDFYRGAVFLRADLVG